MPSLGVRSPCPGVSLNCLGKICKDMSYSVIHNLCCGAPMEYKLCMYTDYTEIQIPIPNKYFGCGYKDLFFAESNKKRAEN